MPEPHLRAADADRAEVAELLGVHMSDGRLTVAEYDERLARAYAARTYGELADLTADLPKPERPPVAHPAPSGATTGCGGPGWGPGWAGAWGHRGGRRSAWSSWLTTAMLVVGIWVLSSIGSGAWNSPWPVWVIGPWGVVLLARTLGGGNRGPGRDRHRERRAG